MEKETKVIAEMTVKDVLRLKEAFDRGELDKFGITNVSSAIFEKTARWTGDERRDNLWNGSDRRRKPKKNEDSDHPSQH